MKAPCWFSKFVSELCFNLLICLIAWGGFLFPGSVFKLAAAEAWAVQRGLDQGDITTADLKKDGEFATSMADSLRESTKAALEL